MFAEGVDGCVSTRPETVDHRGASCRPGGRCGPGEAAYGTVPGDPGVPNFFNSPDMPTGTLSHTDAGSQTPPSLEIRCPERGSA
ncbi:hypothetical protein P3T37_007158 [Kitasatospora sp. MAA4]|nr:hypothetical protein [Kitasatospora sp. MAA4]